MTKYGLLIDYNYCTGCHGCEVACKQEHGLPKGQHGIQVFQMGPWQASDGKWVLDYVPVPTDLCDLCAKRVSTGRIPTCAHHCQANCIEYGPVEELASKAAARSKVSIFVPR